MCADDEAIGHHHRTSPPSANVMVVQAQSLYIHPRPNLGMGTCKCHELIAREAIIDALVRASQRLWQRIGR